MPVIDFFAQPGWQRLGFALLHFLWQGALVALMTAGLVGLFRLRRGVARYRAYLLGFAVMAICPVATYLWLETPRADVIETTDAHEASAFAPPTETVRLETPVPEPFEVTASRERTETTHASDALPIASDPNPRTVIVQDLRGKIIEFGRQAVPWSLVAWLVGVVVLGSRMLLGVVGSYRWRRGLLPLPDELRRRAAALSERFGAAAGRIRLSPSAVQPLVIGYLKPLVLLPASLAAGMSPELLEAVIAHELAHVRRLDPLVNLLQRIVETLLFYHPALWWLSSRVRAEREVCCDEMAVQHTGDPVVYATALERAGRMRLATAQPAPALGLLNGRRPLLARIRLILGAGKTERKPASSWPAGLLAVAMVVAVAAAIEFASPVEAAPVEGKRLFGRVVDDKGEPVPGVEISVVTVDEHPLRQALRIWVRTDQQGRFDVTAPLAGVKYYVMAEGRGGRIPRFMPGTGEEIILTLEARETRELSGIVLAASGEPVTGTTVVLVREDGSIAEARTDDQGRYRIDVAGRLGQSVMHAETAELISPYQMVRNPDHPIDFTLGLPAGLKGVVKDQLSGKPVGGCTVTLKPPFSCGFTRTATTDDAGRFSIVHVPPGEYEAGAASGTHYEPPTRGAFLERPEFPLTAGQSSFREITIRPMTTVVGRVLRHDGQPAVGALAGMQAFWDMDRKHQYQRSQADAEGRFLIRTGRLNETLKVVSECGGFAQIKLMGAVEGETLDLGDVRLSATINIRGTVRDPDGKPVTGVSVSCVAGPGGSGRAVTDDDGRFDLGRLALGTDHVDSLPVKILAPRSQTPGVVILVQGEGTPSPKPDPNTRYFHHQELKLKATPGKEFELDVTLKPAESLAFSGRIVDSAGKPLAGARVVCFAGDARKTWYRRFMPDLNISGGDISFHSLVQIGMATSDADGKWIIRTVRQNADDLRLGHHASQPETSRYSIGVIGPRRQTKLIRDITIEEHAAPRSIEIVLPERPASSISGRVVDTEGQPLTGVTVGLGHMFGANMPISGVETTETGDDGVFSVSVDESTNAAFLRVEAKGWSIQSPKSDRSGKGLRLSRAGGGFSDLTVVMARTGRVTGTVRWSSGEPVVDYEVHGYRESPRLVLPKQRITSGKDVEFALRAVPPGDGRIWISTPSGVGALRHVRIAPGGLARVDVVLPKPTCVIRGRMVDGNGNPTSGARVDIDGKGNSGFEFGKHATPKRDGGFEFKVPAGVYRLTIAPLDPGSWRKTRPEAEVTVAEGETADEVVLMIRKAGWGNLIVEVVDKGGRPMPGVTVRSGGFGSVGNAPTAETDVAGRFLFKGVNAGKHYIVLTDPNRMLNENMRLRIPIEAGKTVTRRIVLDGGRRVRGRVTCAGQPVNNVHVKTSIEAQKRYSSCHTSEDGVFQFLLVPDGQLTIGCFSYMSNQTVTKSFDIAGDHRDDIEIELPTGRITGKILDRHGRLLKGRYIKLEQLQAYGDIPKAPYASTHHCEDGLINLPHLGDGQYRLTLKDDYSSSSTVDILAVSDPIEIRNGKPVEDFVIREQ